MMCNKLISSQSVIDDKINEVKKLKDEVNECKNKLNQGTDSMQMQNTTNKNLKRKGSHEEVDCTSKLKPQDQKVIELEQKNII
jgi:cell division septum initiation protein DivIVA